MQQWLLLLSLASAAYSSSVNDSLLWGPYRPNLYFGLRPRIPQSLMTGLIWFGTQDYTSIGQSRHACDQGDQLQSYTWTKYDPREGGVQVIKDARNNVQLTTEFLKVPGGDHGGNWAARIKGQPLDPLRPSRISTIFYFGLEGLGGIDMDTDEEENGLEGDIKFTGSSPELDDFVIRVVDGPNNVAVTEGPQSEAFKDRIGKTHFIGQQVPAGNIWQAKEFIMQSLMKRAQDVIAPYRDSTAGGPDPSFVLQLPDEVYSSSNLYAIQKLFDGGFQFDVFFESASSKQKLSSSILDEGITALSSSFDWRFKKIFPVAADYASSTNKEALESFSQAITSNLIGGVGYFYGTSIVNEKFSFEWDEEDDGEDSAASDEVKGPRLTEPKKLLTATPSRSFFPRGFYWDEGFHLLHIGAWDSDFSLEILQDWINLIDESGWVAREQILGEEARSKVPAEFLTQVPNYANPPTLTVAVTAFIRRVKASSSGPSDADLGMDFGMAGSQTPLAEREALEPGSLSLDAEVAINFLKGIYKPLKRHYDWFRRTQRGQIKQYARKARSRTEAYRWRGRSEKHVLTSGMDDYPRGPPHAGELHLDLISWMGLFSRTMREIAEFIGEVDDAISYAEIEKAILDNIEDLHWSEEEKMYCDLNVDNDDESYHVCHKGYLSLFPFMLSLLPPDSPHLGAILDMVRDPEHLWSDYGIRSLAASHPEYGTGENYWKGPIWVQMNYLVLESLYNKYAVEDGPYKLRAQEIYRELRKNIIDNVFKEYERTGYVWEQYDPNTGHGQRSHPFTGWTSLVAMILTEKY
ncbi:glycoside hydrolase family 63 protein [Collybiopsis luxurians FD-317 M1]|uniref:Mannosyl-oligosaccharide glucosidase n=1 Tax=Collybiopsis luxurians FD-317 M1 TaxID=944289 RepID=A0A0D0BIF6_9AGAR|nr:glycoside hydrolase family 63 protein [Collybiopsis luxurians FD-317 M1]